MAETKKIVINIGASELAACVGLNPYKNPSEVFVSILSKYFPERGIQTDAQKAKALLENNQLGNELEKEIKEKAGSINPETLQEKVKEAQTKLKNSFSGKDKELVNSYLQSTANTIQGTKCEDDTAQKLKEQGVCTQLVEDHAFYRMPILETSELKFQLVGRIDRIDIQEDGTKTLIEIKNRARKLFGEVKEYEEVQVQAYLQLLNLTQAKLVEQYPKTNSMNVFSIQRDQERWDTELFPKLVAFCQSSEETIQGK